MADTNAPNPSLSAAQNASVPVVNIPAPRKVLDFATLLGLIFSFGLIAGAIALGQSDANFFNVPSLMIVIFGTITATAISYTGEEIKQGGNIIAKSLFRKIYDPQALANALVDLSVVAKKKGILALSSMDKQLEKDEFLARAVQMAIDGGKPKDIDYILTQETGFLAERHLRTASITRRASEVAPAMGLIGTLVGLVQMLADLENPETIGPAMAVALLTTFYGAIMGTIVMAPLAVKLEKNSRDEVMIKTMIRLATISMAQQDNPRKLEMELNAVLPPSQHIRYFD